MKNAIMIILFVTQDFLKERGACPGAVERFSEKFGKGASLLDVLEYIEKKKFVSYKAWLIAQPEFCKALVEYGADVKIWKSYALRHAAAEGNLNEVKYLVSKKADVQACHNGATQHAAENRDFEMIEYLLLEGADVRACGYYVRFRLSVRRNLRRLGSWLRNGLLIAGMLLVGLFVIWLFVRLSL